MKRAAIEGDCVILVFTIFLFRNDHNNAAADAVEIHGVAGRTEINRNWRERLAALRRSRAVDRAWFKTLLRPGAFVIGFNGGGNVASAENLRESDRYSADPASAGVRDASGNVVQRRHARLCDSHDAPGDHHRPRARVGTLILGDYEINHARAHSILDAVSGGRDDGDPQNVAFGAPFHAVQGFDFDFGGAAADAELPRGLRDR